MLPETLVKNERDLTVTDDGGSEIDADVALKQVVKTIDDVIAKYEGKYEIEHVAPCAFWHSLVGVDERGKPTTKVFGWADTRSRKYTDVLRNRFDEAQMHNRTGARFHSSFWPAKLLWLRKEFPDAFRRTAQWLSFSDLLALKLFGVATMGVSMASATGMFDLREGGWNSTLSKFLKIRSSSLPRIADDGEAFQLDRKFAKRWPQLRNAKWFAAIGDGAANNIGAGCVSKSKAALMIGTSGAMRVAYGGKPPAKIPSGLWCYRIDRKRIILGGALSDGGGLYARLKESLRTEMSDDAIADEISRRGAGAHGLTVMPFFAGERSTGYNEDAAGSIIGLSSSHDAIDILQAAMESIAFRFAEILDQIRLVAPVKEIVASGGALASSLVWTQIVADVLGRDLSASNRQEASMRGAVLLALESLGKIENIQRVSTETTRIAFHPKCHRTYVVARKRHIKHYDTLIQQNEHRSKNG